MESKIRISRSRFDALEENEKLQILIEVNDKSKFLELTQTLQTESHNLSEIKNILPTAIMVGTFTKENIREIARWNCVDSIEEDREVHLDT